MQDDSVQYSAPLRPSPNESEDKEETVALIGTTRKSGLAQTVVRGDSARLPCSMS